MQTVKKKKLYYLIKVSIVSLSTIFYSKNLLKNVAIVVILYLYKRKKKNWKKKREKKKQKSIYHDKLTI